MLEMFCPWRGYIICKPEAPLLLAGFVESVVLKGLYTIGGLDWWTGLVDWLDYWTDLYSSEIRI